FPCQELDKMLDPKALCLQDSFSKHISPRGYSQGEDEKAGAQQAPLNSEPLGGGQLAAVYLHASEEQQG
ncbi:hypothetical protein U0070_009198, partial [Myodes glareolus]